MLKSVSLAATGIALALLTLPYAGAYAQDRKMEDVASIERGRYLVQIGGCNDCHTAGYPESGGKIPEAQWLTGDKLGWSGPWGTTYPANLRLTVQKMTEQDWVKMTKTTQLRPPMPWFNLRDMTEQDLASIYRYLRHLGPAGEPAPAYLPPGQKPDGPVVQFPMGPK